MFDEFGEDKPEEEQPTDYTGLIIFAATLPFVIFFYHIGKLEVGLNLSICLGMNALAVKLRWELRRRIWFWAVVALVLALEMPLVLIIQWPHEWVSKVTLLPIGVAGLGIMLGAIWLVQNFIVRAPSSDEEG